MIVPDHWAEARRQHRARGRQVTVRRFGWSETDPAAAQAMADARADEALARVLAGEKLARREPKRAYNGADVSLCGGRLCARVETSAPRDARGYVMVAARKARE